MELFVIAGHGAGDPGAVGNGFEEAELVRALATRIKQLGGDSVGLGDFGRNYYADGGLNTLNVPSGCKVIELHLDSAGAGARGGHVVIKGGLSADAFDDALADFIGSFFPGRAQLIQGRGDLANVNIAANRGIDFRLLEVCFISDSGDVTKLVNNMDEVAAGILAAAGIEVDMATPIEIWGYKNESMNGDADAYRLLTNAAREISRTDDPSGRGQNLTTHEHVKWMAAKQASMDAKLDAIIAALEKK